MAELFAQVGILTKGDVVLKTASDLIGTVVGDSGNKVKSYSIYRFCIMVYLINRLGSCGFGGSARWSAGDR